MPKSIGLLRRNKSAYCGWDPAGDSPDRAGIAAEREDPPFLRIVVVERNTGIVLDDGGAVGEQKIANRGEVAGVQQIRRALDQAVARRQRRAEFQETARL